MKFRITHKLSGGEKKLVALASILAMEPDFLLLDEPLAGLDPDTRSGIIRLLEEMNIPMIIISHDNDFLLNITHRTYTFKHGRLEEILGHIN